MGVRGRPQRKWQGRKEPRDPGKGQGTCRGPVERGCTCAQAGSRWENGLGFLGIPEGEEQLVPAGQSRCC